MSRRSHLADNRCEPWCGSTGGPFARGVCRPSHRAAKRLVLALVRWQIRRLERRIAALEIDDSCLR
jgi:hypothetical protein